MGLDHHGAVVGVLRIALEALCLLLCQGRPVHAVRTVNFLRDQLNALTQRHFERIEELDLVFLVAGVNDRLSKLNRAFAAVAPVVGQCAADTLLLAELADEGDLGVGVGIELVDADDRYNAGLLDGIDVVEQVLAALFQQLKVLLGVLRGEGTTGNDRRTAAVHLERADGRDQNGDVRGQTG